MTTTISQLNQHEGMDLVNQGLVLNRQLTQTTKDLADMKEQLREKEHSLKAEQAELENQKSLQDTLADEVEELIQDNQQYLSYLNFEELDAVYSEKLRKKMTDSEWKYWLANDPFYLSKNQYQLLLYRMDCLLEVEEREEEVLAPLRDCYQENLTQ
ncbi:hypothetical protein [Enterococcus sp. DIV1420a]|uniref:hypothetical protein n=1 Tax=Enterococcus sp. DIV1420a TaxID=2774672 RepID=UPI003F221DCB